MGAIVIKKVLNNRDKSLMMKSKIYHKNNIICGPLDAYCLVCENYINNEQDINAHILKPIHKKNLGKTPYCEKYKDDHIRKVKRGYYCELCNLLLSTLTKVKLHVSEVQHNSNKSSQSWSRVSRGVVAFGQFFISEDAWNGFIDGTCFICNEQFQDEYIHKSEGDHILKLIDSKIIFVDNSFYRETTHGYQCLTCNKKIELDDNTIMEHFEHPDHMSKREKSAEYYLFELSKTTTNKYEFVESDESISVKLVENAENHTESYDDGYITLETSIVNSKVDKEQIMDKCDPLGRIDYIIENGSNNSIHHDTQDGKNSEINNAGVDNPQSLILESLTEFQNNDININFINGTAVCQQCSKRLPISFDEIQFHIEEHKQCKKEEKHVPIPLKANDNETLSVKKSMLYAAPVLTERPKEEQAGNDNAVSVSARNEEINTRIPRVDHIDNVAHGSIKQLPVENTELKLNKDLLSNCFKALFHLKHNESGFRYLALEDRFVVPEDSFFMIMLNSLQGYTCYFCEISFIAKERAVHLGSTKHLEGMDNVNFIISLDSEFVREIRSGVFHCGYCNIVELCWNSLKKHLNTTQHRETKQLFNWHLRCSKDLIQKTMNNKKLFAGDIKSYYRSLFN